jgi:hypothetical protein
MRHRVVALLDLDVIVETDSAVLPFGEDVVGLGRQWLECRPLQFLEQRTSARAEMPRHAIVDLPDQLGDRRVQLGEREEASRGLGIGPQQPQRHPWPTQLTMDCRPVRPWPTILGRDRRRRVEPGLQRLLR